MGEIRQKLEVLTIKAIAVLLGFLMAVPQAGASDLDRIEVGSFAVGEAPPVAVLRVVCLNVERGYRLAEITSLFRKLQADVYILQETDVGARRTGYKNIAREIAEALEMHYVFAVEFEELKQSKGGRPAYHGQATISRYPIINPRVLRFENQPYDWSRDFFQRRRGGRMALLAEVVVGPQKVLIVNTHLESRADDKSRAGQSEEITRYYEQNYHADLSVIVAGDFNTSSGFLPLRTMENFYQSGLTDSFAGSFGPKATAGNKRLDWILYKNFQVISARVLHSVAVSDHDPLEVVFTFTD